MSEYSFLTYPLPAGVSRFLETAVELATQNEVLTVQWMISQSEQRYGAKDYRLDARTQHADLENLMGGPEKSLAHLGFIELFGRNDFFLTAQAFKWADYQRKSPVGKRLSRLSIGTRDVVYGATTALALVLTVCRITDLAR
jgi:hypothetical protein